MSVLDVASAQLEGVHRMPYASDKQRRFMHAQHPQIAKRWDSKYGGKIAAGPKPKPSKYDTAEERKRKSR